MAGHWTGVTELNSGLKSRIQALSTVGSLGDVMNEADYALTEFAGSSRCRQGEIYELLVSGFIQGEPKLLTVRMENRESRLEVPGSFAVVGSGYFLAQAILQARECHPLMSRDYVMYLAYEAKRLSQKTGFVGEITGLAVQADMQVSNDRAGIAMLSEIGIANLESLYGGLWKVPLFDLPKFPDEWFSSILRQ